MGGLWPPQPPRYYPPAVVVCAWPDPLPTGLNGDGKNVQTLWWAELDQLHSMTRAHPPLVKTSLAEPDPLLNLSTREERVWSSDIERLVLASPANGGGVN